MVVGYENNLKKWGMFIHSPRVSLTIPLLYIEKIYHSVLVRILSTGVAFSGKDKLQKVGLE